MAGLFRLLHFTERYRYLKLLQWVELKRESSRAGLCECSSKARTESPRPCLSDSCTALLGSKRTLISPSRNFYSPTVTTEQLTILKNRALPRQDWNKIPLLPLMLKYTDFFLRELLRAKCQISPYFQLIRWELTAVEQHWLLDFFICWKQYLKKKPIPKHLYGAGGENAIRGSLPPAGGSQPYNFVQTRNIQGCVFPKGLEC